MTLHKLIMSLTECSSSKNSTSEADPVTFISVCDQPPRLTQPGHPSCMGRRNEYQSKGGDALRLGSKGRYGSCVGGR